MTGDNGKPHDSLAQDAKEFVVDDFLGAKEWKRSKLGYLTGASIATSAVGSLVGNARGSIGRIKTLYGAAFGRDTSGVAVSDEIVDTRERFKDAMRANQKTIADVNHSVDITYKQFFLYGILSLASVVLAAFMDIATFLRGSLNVFNFLFSFFPLLIMIPLTLRAGYTNWMFRRRRLDGITDYLKSGSLLPKKAPPMPKSVANPVATVRSKKVMVAIFAVFMATGFVAFAGDKAYAQPSAGQASMNQILAAPNSTDLFVNMLTVIVPGVGPVPNGAATWGVNPGATAANNALGIFAGVLLVLGVGMSGYQMIAGLVASAKEGTALGQKYHEVWAPIRMVVGYGFLTPMLGGLCAAQVLCVYLIVWGGNMANVIWSSYANSLVSMASFDTNAANSSQNTQNAIVGGIIATQAKQVVRDIASKSLCLAAVRAELTKEKVQGVGTSAPTLAPKNAGAAADAGNISRRYVASFVEGANATTLNKVQNAISSATGGAVPTANLINCGSITIDVPIPITEANKAVSGNAVQSAVASSMITAINGILPKIYTETNNWAQTYVSKGDQGGQPPAFGTGGGATTGVLLDAVTSYVSALQQAAQTAFTANSPQGSAQTQMASIQTAITQQGWAASGTFYLTLARVSQAMYGSLNVPYTGAPGNIASQGVVDPAMAALLNGQAPDNGVLGKFTTWFDNNMGPASTSSSASVSTGASTISTDDALSHITSSIGTSAPTLGVLNWAIMGSISIFNQATDSNPFSALQHMIDLGNYFMYTGEFILLVTSALSGIGNHMVQQGAGAFGIEGWAANSLSAGSADALFSAIGGAMTGFGTVLSMVAFGIISAGILHAYILPMMPYLQVTFFVLTMLALVAESLVAAPLWAFFHIRMDGQEFVDQVQQPGYMIAFNLLLRPSLMIFGLILSNLVFGAMVYFVSHTFYPAVTGMNASNSIGPIGAGVFIVMVAYIHYQCAVRSFHLITELPDRVTRWFGYGGERFQDTEHAATASTFVAGKIDGGAKDAMRAMVASQAGKDDKKPTRTPLDMPPKGKTGNSLTPTV